MRVRYTLMLGLAGIFCALASTSAHANYWDEFDDAEIYEDPNVFDIDDPCWSIYKLIGSTWDWDPNGGELRLHASTVFGAAFLGAVAEDGDTDANTSQTWYDCTSPHYILAKVRWNPGLPDEGAAGFVIHGNFVTWVAYIHDYQADDGWYELIWVDGSDFKETRGGYTRNDLDEPNGFWMLAQFDPNGGADANDPNNHKLRTAAWNEGKFDWEGGYDIDLYITTAWDPNEFAYRDEGGYAITALCSAHTGDTLMCDVKYDHIESRWGYFTNVSRTLTVKLKDCSSLNLEPNLAHPDGGDKRRYTQGTSIVLDTVVPVGNKVFKKWTVKGPNESSDPLYQIVSDTNEVLYLTMDGNYLVKATCKCGGGGIEPFAGMVLLVLALALTVRRLQ